jgi:hypothetical protein
MIFYKKSKKPNALEQNVSFLTGNLATGKALEGFDTNGVPIQVGGVRMKSRGQLPKE